MTKVRQDAWSHEDDLLLAETVLRHIREGSTQLDAFEEVGDRLNRTGAACGFRWNAIVRRKYEQAIEIAKKQRKQKKRVEQRGRYAHPAPAVPAMETAYLADPSETLTNDKAKITADTAPVVPSLSEPSSPSINLDQIISYLQSLQTGSLASGRIEEENKQLTDENNRLKQRTGELEDQVKKLQNHQQTVEEDYQALMGIMDRARRMVAFQNSTDESGSTFKMDANGNLEKVAK